MSHIKRPPPGPHHTHHAPLHSGHRARARAQSGAQVDGETDVKGSTRREARKLGDPRKIEGADLSGNEDRLDDPERHRQALLDAQADGLKTESKATGATTDTLAHTEREVTLLMGEVEQILDELATIEAQAAGLSQLDSPGPAGARGLRLRLESAETELKNALRQLLSGDLGFKLFGDPAITFQRLFSQLRRWPAHIPPSRLWQRQTPWSEAEWNAFVTWASAPPPPDTDLAW